MTGDALGLVLDEPVHGPTPARRWRVPVAVSRALLAMLQSARELGRPAPTRLRLIGTLFGRASNLFMVALAAFICGSAVWARGGGWLAAAIASVEVAMLLARCGIILAFENRRRAGIAIDPNPWLIGFGILAIGSSMSWGALCFLCLAFSHDPVLYVIPVLSTVGTAGAVAARNSGVPRLARIQLACSLTPILAGCALADDRGFLLLLLLVPAMATGLLILISERNQQLVELIETQAELARLSQTDELTKVPNRRYFDAHLDAVIATAAASGASFALLMVDVDNFKAFNDRYGHPTGDALLKQIAEILRDTLRDANDVIARYGGEEFAILLEGADVHDAAAVGERLRQSVQSMCRPLGGESLTISVGLDVATGASDPATVIRRADSALYLAKRCGRNRVVIADASDDSGVPPVGEAA